jgi:DNA mismatch repair protein MutS2
VNAKTLTTLELPKILERVARHASFSAGEALVRGLAPATDLPEVRRRQQLTTEAVRLLNLRPEVSLGGIHDIRDRVRHAELGAILDAEEYLNILSTLEAARQLRGLILKTQEQKDGLPGLAGLADRIALLPRLEAEFRRIFDPEGNILDSASAALGKIRARVRVAHNRVREKLNQIINSERGGHALQEPIIVERGGRYVLPVKADFKGQLRGIVHDQSASGATLFIEPLGVVELANEWRQAQMEEAEEIERILRALSAQIGAESGVITATVDTLAQIDLALAKAKYSQGTDATEPALGLAGPDREGIFLRNARHPLLTGRVVPITVELGQRFHMLLITGPNTGGKTVALKTVGLLTLMAQCGLHVPADPGSRLLVFRQVFADIGDEQSIEQSLSTFSSHMRNIITILGQVDSQTLVLLDELGAGTDPTEGAALARAIVHHLLERGALTIATTHYSELKAFAYATEGVENASVEFDIETLAPTYKLTVGLPGRSNALAIATRLGMTPELVEAARSYIDPTEVRVENLIDGIRQEREALAEERVRAERARRAVEDQGRELQTQLRNIDRLRQEALNDARRQAEEEIAEVRELLKRVRTDAEAGALTRQWVADNAHRLEETQRDLRQRRRQRPAATPAPGVPTPAPQEAPRPLRPGDRVRVPTFDAEGDVLTVPDSSGMVEVQVGMFKMRLVADELERVRRPRQDGDGWSLTSDADAAPSAARSGARAWHTDEGGRRANERSGASVLQRAAAAAPSLEADYRGWRAEEVEPALDQYLQDAALAGMPMVRIIHGKGTGVLRDVVRTILKRHPLVRGWQPAPIEQGGEGATLAFFDKPPAPPPAPER